MKMEKHENVPIIIEGTANVTGTTLCMKITKYWIKPIIINYISFLHGSVVISVKSLELFCLGVGLVAFDADSSSAG